jgi:hypothetical protein
MKAILLAGVAVGLLSGAPAIAKTRVECPPAAAARAEQPYALSASDAARDTAYRDYVRDTHELGYWQELKAGWPRADYDLIYGPGAFHQNYELPGLPK